jgi:hypothetical protein
MKKVIKIESINNKPDSILVVKNFSIDILLLLGIILLNIILSLVIVG